MFEKSNNLLPSLVPQALVFFERLPVISHFNLYELYYQVS